MRKIVLFGDSITAGYLDEAVSPVLVDLVKRDIAAMGLEKWLSLMLECLAIQQRMV